MSVNSEHLTLRYLLIFILENILPSYKIIKIDTVMRPSHFLQIHKFNYLLSDTRLDTDQKPTTYLKNTVEKKLELRL